MSIEIYTYQNPFKLDEEPFWPKVKNCPWFTASQVLSRGMKEVYRGKMYQGLIQPVSSLLEQLFPNWNSRTTSIRRYTVLDREIQKFPETDLPSSQIKNMLDHSRDDLVKSLKSLSALGILPDQIDTSLLGPQQTILVNLYKEVVKGEEGAAYRLPITSRPVDEAIMQALLRGKDADRNSPDEVRTIVFQGIHNFTPEILRAISILDTDHHVILLFHYQKEYSALFETWKAIYGNFGVFMNGILQHSLNLGVAPINESQDIAFQLASILQGNRPTPLVKKVDVTVYDSLADFSNDVSFEYDRASELNHENPFSTMQQHFYAADLSANEYLKQYYPAQYGTETFLDTPLGHFFKVILDFYDPSSTEAVIETSTQLEECMESGMLGSNCSHLLNTFHKVHAVLSLPATISEVIEQLENVADLTKKVEEENRRTRGFCEKANRISYLQVSKEDLQELTDCLKLLKTIAKSFYQDFYKNNVRFEHFYKTLNRYLSDYLEEFNGILEDEYKELIRSALSNLKELDAASLTGSLQVLAATMNLALEDPENSNKSSMMIVRGFEQIEGDMLLSRSKPANNTYHFASLGSSRMTPKKNDRLSWPLTLDLFDAIKDTNLASWILPVYKASIQEFARFKPYALFYGLENNYINVKLSYIKDNQGKEDSLYPLLGILQPNLVVPKPRYFNSRINDSEENTKQRATAINAYSDLEVELWQSCPLRFVNTVLVEKNAVYSDTFLLQRYFESLLAGEMAKNHNGRPFGHQQEKELYAKAESWHPFFPFLSKDQVFDSAKRIAKDLKKYHKSSRFTTRELQSKADYAENFITVKRKRDGKRNKPYIQTGSQEIIRNKLGCTFCPYKNQCGETVKDDKEREKT